MLNAYFEALGSCKLLLLMLIGLWLASPFMCQTFVHPQDLYGMMAWSQGLPIPTMFTKRSMLMGAGMALIGLGVLIVFQFFIAVQIFRRTGKATPLWPLAVVLIGGVANLIWYLRLGYLDWSYLSSLTPLVPALLCQIWADSMGRRFIFGNSDEAERI